MHTRIDGHHIGLILLQIVFLAPLVAILYFTSLPGGSTLSHLISTVLPGYVGNTLTLILGIGVLTAFGGTVTAWIVTTYQFTGRGFFSWALFLPLTFPAYVMAFVYGGMFEYAGPIQTGLRNIFGWSHGEYWFPEIRSLYGAIFIMSMVFYPYVYILARLAFMKNHDSIAVSRTLGTTLLGSFFRVALPAARPAIIGGVTLALMETLADFGTVQHFAVDTFTTAIYRSWYSLHDQVVASKLATILLLFVFSLVMIERASRGNARYTSIGHCACYRQRIILKNWQNFMAFSLCLIPIFFGFLLPIYQLLVWAGETYSEVVDIRFFELAINTITVSSIAAIIALVLAFFLAYALRFHRSRAVTTMVRSTAMGYAVPGSVIAVGILITFGWIDNRVDDWMRENLGIHTGLILSGTMFALIFAYVFRFLSLSMQSVESGLTKVTVEIDWAASMLGLSILRRLRKIHMPIISGSALAALLLVFVEGAKELPATLIIRPFNFDTLATYTYLLASDERLAESANSALMIVLVGMIPIIFLSKMVDDGKCD